MKRFGHLFETVVSFENLLAAAKETIKGKKNRPEAARFFFHMETEVLALREELKQQTYRPGLTRSFVIYDPKTRLITAAAIRDRAVHHALCRVLEEYFERSYIFHSYACRKGKGLHAAVRQTRLFCRRYRYFLKMDIRKFFESIHHGVLMNILERRFKDRKLLGLLDVIVRSGGEIGKGVPIGNLTSQHFANLYLDRLDHFIKEKLGVKGYIRYMDDFILFAQQKEYLHRMKAEITSFLNRTLLLELKEKATSLAPCYTGIPFLGFRIFSNLIRIKGQNRKRFIRKLKKRESEFQEGLIDEKKYQQCLQSMTEHLKIADSLGFRRKVFHGLSP